MYHFHAVLPTGHRVERAGPGEGKELMADSDVRARSNNPRICPWQRPSTTKLTYGLQAPRSRRGIPSRHHHHAPRPSPPAGFPSNQGGHHPGQL